MGRPDLGTIKIPECGNQEFAIITLIRSGGYNLYRIAFLALAGTLAFAQTPAYQPLASTKQLMSNMQKPAMDALGAMNKAGGPKDDKEWEAAAAHAVMLAESAHLLTLGDRPSGELPRNQEVWTKGALAQKTAGEAAAKAAGEKNLESWKTALNGLNGSCRTCHTVHRKRAAPAAQAAPPAAN